MTVPGILPLRHGIRGPPLYLLLPLILLLPLVLMGSSTAVASVSRRCCTISSFCKGEREQVLYTRTPSSFSSRKPFLWLGENHQDGKIDGGKRDRQKRIHETVDGQHGTHHHEYYKHQPYLSKPLWRALRLCSR